MSRTEHCPQNIPAPWPLQWWAKWKCCLVHTSGLCSLAPASHLFRHSVSDMTHSYVTWLIHMWMSHVTFKTSHINESCGSTKRGRVMYVHLCRFACVCLSLKYSAVIRLNLSTYIHPSLSCNLTQALLLLVKQTGLAINTAGGCLFAYYKLLESSRTVAAPISSSSSIPVNSTSGESKQEKKKEWDAESLRSLGYPLSLKINFQIRIYICTNTYLSTYTYSMFTYVCVCVCVWIHTYTHIHDRMHVGQICPHHTGAHTHVYTYIRTYICMIESVYLICTHYL